MAAALAICCFVWLPAVILTDPPRPVDGYFIMVNEKPTAHAVTESACVAVPWGADVYVQAYNRAERRVGPRSPLWEGEEWGRCVDV